MRAGRFYRQLMTYILIIVIFAAVSWIGSRAIHTVAQMIPLERRHTFVIDPGHGGIDGGATSYTGRLESTYNLEISLILRDLLHFLGNKTVMIRTSDRSVYCEGETIAAQKISDLKERVRIVNDTPGSILLSIHQNTFSDSRYSGAQVFYGPGEKSKAMAEQMQEALNGALDPISRRQAKSAGQVYLMQNIRRPGILIECGFLSNPQEEAKLRDPVYQRKLCCVIASRATRFLTENN